MENSKVFWSDIRKKVKVIWNTKTLVFVHLGPTPLIDYYQKLQNDCIIFCSYWLQANLLFSYFYELNDSICNHKFSWLKEIASLVEDSYWQALR